MIEAMEPVPDWYDPTERVYIPQCASLIDGDALEAILDEYDVTWVAPIHGHPIRGDDLDRHLDRLIDAAGRIAAEYDVPDT